MTAQFSHKTLAKTHHFIVRFSFRIKVRTPFSASHRQSRQTVFKYLFKRKKFQNAKRDGWMKAKTTFIRSDRAIHLDAITAVYMNFSLIIHPGNTKHDDSFG